jgi:type IV pilus assembly protein PilV
MAGIAAAAICSKKIGGFSLIEVLVALFLQAFGMLGITAMQIRSLKSTHAALIDSRVHFLLSDMAERINGNSHSRYEISFTTQTIPSGKNCAAVVCGTEDMVAWDIGQWRLAVENSTYLPRAESQIVFNDVTATYEISIRYEWSELDQPALIDQKRTVSLTASAHK